ncbi:MAG: formylmethanofuran dehydrogenase subunit E family protein, partial [Atribacterota bacterium]|nr:formylmethanofuran dehydrogenase subunit E family protein [Atribacterota bacterium]
NLGDMIERGIKLHGHAGPYLNLGIKMGLLALKNLKAKGYFDLSVEAELEYRRPMSCFVDGLQISTGCTMGKGNIKVKNQTGNINALFKTEDKNLRIFLKPEIVKSLDFEKESCEDLSQKVLDIPNAELFDYFREKSD